MRDIAPLAYPLLGIWLCLVGCSDAGVKSSTNDESTTSAGGAPPEGSAPAAGGAAGEAGASCAPSAAPRGNIECDGEADIFASEVVDHEFGPGQDTGQDQFPELVLGPPEGLGENQGAVAGVVSLGNGGWVTLGFGGNAIVDGPGVDFIVFENAFRYGAGGDQIFAELATVSVSADGEHWVDFPCTASEEPYGACAGWHPVLANGDEEDLDHLDPTQAGGDQYDLADVCLEYARFVRVTDREDLDRALDGVFDLDAVGIVNEACEGP